MRLSALPGEAVLPAEGYDPAGQELPGLLDLAAAQLDIYRSISWPLWGEGRIGYGQISLFP